MDVQSLTTFFMWCTIINGGILMFWALIFAVAPEPVYRIQNRLFPIHRETYNTLVYVLLGLFKVLFLVFNLVPFLALLAIQ